jgi:pilus assembly protein Flp/PilA
MVEFVKALFGTFGNDEEAEGQGLVEYALILVLISVVAITIMTTVGGQVSDVFTSISAAL